MANEAGKRQTLQTLRGHEVPLRRPVTAIPGPHDAGIHAEAGILAPEPWTARLQLRDSAGLAPDFPHFSLTPSDEALCCAFGCGGTLPWGSEVVKDACIARDHGRIVHGLLARGEAKGDGRAVVVCLTDTGTALIDRVLAYSRPGRARDADR